MLCRTYSALRGRLTPRCCSPPPPAAESPFPPNASWAPPLHDGVMSRRLVKPLEQLPGVGRNHGGFIVLAREPAHGIQRVEPHQGEKLDRAVDVTATQVDAAVARDPALLDAGKDLAAQQRLVAIRVARSGPASPDPR